MNPIVTKSVVSTTLIGRASQLAALDSWLTRASDEGSQVMLVTGEAGIGKSRLVMETCFRAEADGWQTVQGRAFEPDQFFPYAPLIDLLRTHLARRPVSEVVALLGPLAAEIVKLLPELALIIPNLTPTPQLDPESEKRRLFEALVQFFNGVISSIAGEMANAAAPDRPLLLIIENLHWSDETSLEFLRYLARRLATQPILLLLTYRSDEVGATLQKFLAALSREQHPTELPLTPFTSTEVDALLRAIFEQQRPIHAEFLDAMVSLTGGNPFFIEEVLKALIASGDLFYESGMWGRKPIDELRIPHSIQDAVQRRVAHLSEEARQTLTVAAVAGRQFDFGVLQTITSCSESELLRQIKEMLAAQLVIEVSANDFAFRHALTQKAIYDELLVRERQHLHRQIGEALEQQATALATASNASLAYHFYTASVWEKALTYARRAGEQAQALNTPHAAIEQFTRALAAAQQLNDATMLPVLYRERGLAHETVGDFDRACVDLEAVLQLARSTGDQQMEWRVLLDLGKLWSSRDYAETGRYVQAALALARALDNPGTLARSLNSVGNWYLNVEAPRRAVAYHAEALEIFKSLDDQLGVAQTADLLGMANMLGGDAVRGAAYCRQAVDLFQASNERQRLASSLTTLLICGPVYTTDTVVPAAMTLAESLAYGQQAVQIASAVGWRAGEAFARTQVGQNLAVQGRYGECISSMQHGLEIVEEIGHRQWICLIHRELGKVHLDLLVPSTARQHLDHSLALAEEIGSSFHIRRTTGYFVALLIVERQFDEAEALLNSIGGLELPMQTLAQRLIWHVRAELAFAKGDSATALQIIDQLFATATNRVPQEIGAIPELTRLRGEALTALRRWSAAKRTLRAGLATARARKMPRLIWRIQVALGKLYQLQGQQAKSEQAFVAARAVIDKIAATISDTNVRNNFVQQANAIMVPPKPSTPLQAAKQAHGGLTRREREVAALVAEGKTNREIAATLVLSVRTVEGYVGNILNKLGFYSRSQIAAWVVENGLRRG